MQTNPFSFKSPSGHTPSGYNEPKIVHGAEQVEHEVGVNVELLENLLNYLRGSQRHEIHHVIRQVEVILKGAEKVRDHVYANIELLGQDIDQSVPYHHHHH